jgi:ribosomal protein S18 acetylase RimI-like enzyme
MEGIPSKESATHVEITDTNPEDALGITTVLYKAWLATYPNEEAGITVEDIEDSYKDRFTEEAIQKVTKVLENIPSNEKRLVARADNKVVGMSRIIKYDENNKLQTIYVLPEYQGKGVGTALWQEAAKFIDPSKDTFLEVAEYNENAINFYKKLGFEDTGKRLKDERFRMKSGSIITEMEMVLRATDK